MASFRQLPSGKWNVQVRRKGFKPQSNTFATKVDAEAWAASLEIKLPADELALEQRQTDERSLSSLSYAYCNEQLQGRPTFEKFLALTDRLSRQPFFNIPLSELQATHITAYKDGRLKAGTSTTTVHWELSFIRRIIKWHTGDLGVSGQVKLPRPKPSRNRVITPQELELLLGALSPKMRPVVELAYETAMRRSEIVKLRVKDIHLSERILDVIDGKEGDRSVPLSKRACELLGVALKDLPNPVSRLFPFAPLSVTRAVKRARDKVGLDADVRLHQLRHTRCTIVAKKGFNQAQIMIVSGHKDVRSIQRYTHLNVRDVLDLLDC
ncbi:site-specific integrase [uncultured Roseibium sp.]|uniref:tyrosine-type recombinase/integrase n=1 Tax=uncultured Roseibium sp. TaxID=1936171 RepID=UPI00261F8F74|nr:site-specific integrase [uncultured Roseibium sp.]